MGKTEDHIDYQIRKTTCQVYKFARNGKPNASKRKNLQTAKNAKTKNFMPTEKPIEEMVKATKPKISMPLPMTFRDANQKKIEIQAVQFFVKLPLLNTQNRV